MGCVSAKGPNSKNNQNVANINQQSDRGQQNNNNNYEESKQISQKQQQELKSGSGNNKQNGPGGLIQKAKQMKQDYDQEKQRKWLCEVLIQETNTFKDLKEWFIMYEPKKQQVNQNQRHKDDNQSLISTEKMINKIGEKMKVQVSQAIMQTLIDNLVKGIEISAKIIQKQEPKIFSFMNSLVATILTYRFDKKNKKKFEYIRGITVDRMAFTFVDAIDYEAKQMGKLSDKGEQLLDEETINKIIDKQTNIIYDKINEEKQKIIQKVKQNSLFAISGINEKDFDEGTGQVLEALQLYLEQKLNIMFDMIKSKLPDLLKIIAQEQQKIKSQIAQQAQSVGIQEPSDEYISHTRQKILENIEIYYQLLDQNNIKFVGQFIDFLLQMTKQEGEEEDKDS